jgi:hypothetical protein
VRHWVIVALVAIIAAAVGAGVALYFAYPTRVELAASATRAELLSLNAPPGTLTTEENAAYKSAAAPTPPPSARPETGRATTRR